MKKTSVKFFHVGDLDYSGTVLITLRSEKVALEYVREWLNAHTTKNYTFKKIKGCNRWESKFTAIYLDTVSM
jgi:hypothetical protein